MTERHLSGKLVFIIKFKSTWNVAKFLGHLVLLVWRTAGLALYLLHWRNPVTMTNRIASLSANHANSCCQNVFCFFFCFFDHWNTICSAVCHGWPQLQNGLLINSYSDFISSQSTMCSVRMRLTWEGKAFNHFIRRHIYQCLCLSRSADVVQSCFVQSSAIIYLRIFLKIFI